MYHKKLLLLIMLALSATAAADFRTISEAHEVDLVNLRLPVSESGTVSFKLCSTCDAQTSRVTGATRYAINNRAYSLAEFRNRVARVKSARNQNVSVLQHLESNTIKAIELWVH